jgi:catechol 2,3-dioxygenase-like lactoylglutathione lyase family enzyme
MLRDGSAEPDTPGPRSPRLGGRETHPRERVGDRRELDSSRIRRGAVPRPSDSESALQARQEVRTVLSVDHLAIPVSDQARSRHFYETYFGFGERPAKVYDGGVVMLYNVAGFALALGLSSKPVQSPSWMHFGVGLPSRDAVLALRDRLVDDGVELVEEWDEPTYVSVKCRDPDGYIVEAFWEPEE